MVVVVASQVTEQTKQANEPIRPPFVQPQLYPSRGEKLNMYTVYILYIYIYRYNKTQRLRLKSQQQLRPVKRTDL